MRISSPSSVFLAAVAAVAVFASAASNVTQAKSREHANPFIISDALALCENVQQVEENQLNCVVTYVQGHPTLAVEFANEPGMNALLGEFSERIAAPFCDAANTDNQSAFFVVALKNPRVGSVSWCKTGESSGWVSIDSLEHP